MNQWSWFAIAMLGYLLWQYVQANRLETELRELQVNNERMESMRRSYERSAN